jgi:hypothetical protein
MTTNNYLSEPAAAALEAIELAQVAIGFDIIIRKYGSERPPWVLIQCGSFQLAIWQNTGAVYEFNSDHTIEDEPIWQIGDGPFRTLDDSR